MQELHLPRVSDVVFAYFPARITALNGTSNGDTYLAPNGNKVRIRDISYCNVFPKQFRGLIFTFFSLSLCC